MLHMPEGMDRSTTELPAAQLEFAQRVLALNKPVVLVLVNGGIVSVDDLLHPSPIYTGNCSASGLYEQGVDLKNTINQTWGPLGPGATVEACCAKCAERTEPSYALCHPCLGRVVHTEDWFRCEPKCRCLMPGAWFLMDRM
jgi:hypothetical protein